MLNAQNGKRAAGGVLALAWLTLAAGCGGGEPQAKVISFATARQATVPVTIEGIPDQSSVRTDTKTGTAFRMREEASAETMAVTAAPDVTVPSNLVSALYVVVTGSYDAATRTFKATAVETRVPNRDQQRRG